MKRVLLIVAIFTFGSVAAAEESTIIGTVSKVTGNNISVKTPRGFFLIPADDKTEVVKDKTYQELSPLKVGDEVSVHCRNPTGKPVAVKVFANVITFSATVRHVADDEIEVLTIPNADYAREERKILRLYADTAFGTSRRDLTVGQDVRIVGLDVGNGAVDASRVALYNTDVPVNKGPRK
jgi:Domain of unknown function (DUF5666)